MNRCPRTKLPVGPSNSRADGCQRRVAVLARLTRPSSQDDRTSCGPIRHHEMGIAQCAYTASQGTDHGNRLSARTDGRRARKEYGVIAFGSYAPEASRWTACRKSMRSARCAVMIRAVKAFGLCLIASAALASEKDSLSGVYPHAHKNIIFNPRTQKDDPIQTEDCLELRSVWADQLAFHFYVYGANGHTCEMQGIAMSTKTGLYEYREKVGGDRVEECVLRIHVSDSEFRLESGTDECRQFCGVRAGFDGITFPRSKSTSRQQCRDWIK